MNHEHHTGGAHEHDLGLHDTYTEHAHEGHVCSSTCEHHQAAQHIDFMESVEHHHDHSHEHSEEHIHGPGCGHVEYEQAIFQVDRGKDKTHFHDPHEEHVHGPNCGHIEYQLAHTEIDTPHVHDEFCGHLDHHKAAEYVDHGKEQKHDTRTEHANHDHKEEHIHGPNCGHVEYEKAHEYVDELTIIETAVEYDAGDASASDNSRQDKVAAASQQMEKAAVRSQQRTETKVAAKPEASTAQDISSSAEATPRLKTAPATPESSDTFRPDKVTVARRHEQTAINTKMRVENEQTNPINKIIEQPPSTEQSPTTTLDADAATTIDELDGTNLDDESNHRLQTEMPLAFADEEPSVELSFEPLFTSEPSETDDETLTGFAPAETDDMFDLMHESDTPAFDLIEDESTTNTRMDFGVVEETHGLEMVENSILENLSDTSEDDELTEELGNIPDIMSDESQFSFSRFGNDQIREVYDMEWPVLAEVDDHELESRLDTSRAFIKNLIEQVSEIDPSELEAMSEQLLVMLQNTPKDSVVELLPLLEELTELYDLPKLEKLLELYFAGHYQEQTMLTQLLGTAAQNTQNITTRLGQAVLELLKLSHQPTQPV